MIIMKCGFVFSGQGSQYLKMGYDLYNEYDFVRDLYSRASAILGYDIAKICFEENDLLNQTIYTQPAMLLTEIALYEVLKRFYDIKPIVMAGFSLGEYGALYASGVFTFDEIINLINIRSRAMHEDSQKVPGMMAAVLGLDKETVASVCASVEDLYVANYNTVNQVVISGKNESVLIGIELLKAKGARRILPLNVSGAFHTKFMKNASDQIYAYLQNIEPKPNNVDVLLNVNSQKLDLRTIKEAMRDQITNPVLFEHIIFKLVYEYQLDTIIEIGPGTVLTNLIKKVNSQINLINLDKLSDFSKLNMEVK